MQTRNGIQDGRFLIQITTGILERVRTTKSKDDCRERTTRDLIEKMLICLLVSGNIEISETGVRDRVCVYECQKELKETVYTTPQYQCPRKLYIDNLDKKD